MISYKLNIIIIVTLLFYSCSKEDIPEDIIGTYWLFQSISSFNETNIEHAPDTTKLYIISDSTYSISTERNGCFGNILERTNNEITLSNPVCTLVGGDSDLAWRFIRLMPNVQRYELGRMSLTLYTDQDLIRLDFIDYISH